jgi:hypothetical protein
MIPRPIRLKCIEDGLSFDQTARDYILVGETPAEWLCQFAHTREVPGIPSLEPLRFPKYAWREVTS